MKRLGVLFAMVGFAAASYAQSADQRVAEMLSREDYLALNRTLPQLQRSLTQPLRSIACALTDAHLRRYDSSNAAIEALLEISDVLDGPTYGMLVGQLLSNYRLAGDNEAAAELMKQIMGLNPDQEHTDAYEYFSTLAALPRQELVRPAHDVEIPFRTDSAGRGVLMLVDVKIGGVVEPFIFDTGCAEMSFVSEEFARSHGIRPTGVEIAIGGVGGDGDGWLGVADSLCVGEMVLRNPVFAVTPALEKTDSVYKINAVLGCNFMTRAGEIRICGKERHIVFPAIKSPAPAYAPNMTEGPNGLYYAEVDADGEKLTMQFDSGNVKSSLSSAYFKAHRKQIEAEYSATKLVTGGFGGIVEGQSYIMPALTLRFGGTIGVLTDIGIAANVELGHETGEAGSLGVDFLLAFDSVTIDFDRMFIAPYWSGAAVTPPLTPVASGTDAQLPHLKSSTWTPESTGDKVGGTYNAHSRELK